MKKILEKYAIDYNFVSVYNFKRKEIEKFFLLLKFMNKKIFTILTSCAVLSSLTACGFQVGTEIPIDEIIKTTENASIEESSIVDETTSLIEENTESVSPEKENLSKIGNNYFGYVTIPGTYTEENIEDLGVAYANEDETMMLSVFRYANDADTLIDVLKETVQNLLDSYNSTEEVYISSLKDLSYDKDGYLICGVIPQDGDNYYLLNFYLFQNDDGTSSYISIEGDYNTINIEDYRDDIINSYTQPTEEYVNTSASTEQATDNTKTINSVITDTDYTINIPEGYEVTNDDSESFVILMDEEGNSITVTTAISSRILNYIEIGNVSENENFAFENMGAYKTSMGTFTVVREYSTYDDSSFNQYYCVLDNEDFAINFVSYNSKPVSQETLTDIIDSILSK